MPVGLIVFCRWTILLTVGVYMSTDGSSESLELRFSEELRSGSTELDPSNGTSNGASNGCESPGYKKPEETYFPYQNRESLAHDLTFLAVMPEMCDVTFLVGEERQPVCGVKAIMAARSWVFRKQLYRESDGKKHFKKLLKKKSEGNMDVYDLNTVVVSEFDTEVFKQLVEYIHTGTVMLQARTILGLMNAADHYGLEDLKAVCTRFVERCITVDMVCSLLTTAERYIQYKSTKMVVQRMFEFVDQNASAILSLGAFYALPQHVVRIILSREDLRATELEKFEAALKWCDAHVDETNVTDLKQVFEPFVDVIDYCQIPAKELMQLVKPLRVVDDAVILTALAYQADPSSVDQSSIYRQRRMRLNQKLSSPFMRRAQSSGTPLQDRALGLVVAELNLGRGSSVPPRDSNSSSPTGLTKSQQSVNLIEAVSRSGSLDSHVSTCSSPILASSGSVSSLSAIELEPPPPGTPPISMRMPKKPPGAAELGCRSRSVDVGLNGHCMSIDV